MRGGERGVSLERSTDLSSFISSMMKRTLHEIEAHQTAKGGWTKKSLAALGVPWPPPKGWKAALLNGTPIPVQAPIVKASKPTPMAEVIAKYETSDGHGSRTITCTSTGCTYPACTCGH